MNKEVNNLRPYVIFLLVGIALFMGSWVLDLNKQPFWADLTLNLAASVTAVTIVQWIWTYIGGEPLERAIIALRTSTSLMKDLEGTGIERIFAERQYGPVERVAHWADLASHAKEIDLMGLTLYSEWFRYEQLRSAVKTVIRDNHGRVRILILDPDEKSPSTAHRLCEPAEVNHPRLMMGLLEGSFSELEKIRKDLNLGDKDEGFEIRLIQSSTVYSMIIRIDYYMFIANYLSHTLGAEAPAMEIAGPRGAAYAKYLKEFDSIWEHATPWDAGVRATSTATTVLPQSSESNSLSKRSPSVRPGSLSLPA